VPVIGDIPILGAAFKGHDDNVQRDEIIFMITPTVMADQTLWDIGSETLSYASEVRVGARQGTLPFSRERQTANANQRAYADYKAGDMDGALHHIRHSLRLNPHQPEMIRLREMINNEIEHPHEFSIQQRVLAQEFGRQFSPGWTTDGTVVQGDSIINVATQTVDQRDAFVTAPLTAAGEQAYADLLAEMRANEASIVQANSNGTINVNAQQVELTEVLEQISDHAEQNILTSESVSSTISTELRGVTVEEALDSILFANGYDYVEENGFIYVFTQAELDQMAWAEAIDASQFDVVEAETYTISDLRKQRMVEAFIDDYFDSLGLAYITPFADTPMANAPVSSAPVMTATVPATTSTEIKPFAQGQANQPVVTGERLPALTSSQPNTTWSQPEIAPVEPEVKTAGIRDEFSPFQPFTEGTQETTEESSELLPSLAGADDDESAFE
jgi:hypothetical protein